MMQTKNALLLMMLSAGSLVLSGCASTNPLGGSSARASNVSSEDNQRSYEIQNHIYAGLGIGRSYLEPDASEVPGVDVNDRVESGGQVTLGVDITRHLAIEGHSADIGSAGLSPQGRINYHILGASALLYAGKNRGNFKRSGFSGYGRVGVGLLDNSRVGDAAPFIQDNGTHLLIGAGLEYMTRFGLGFRAEAISFDEDANFLQVGMLYRTGKRRAEKPVQLVKAPEPVAPPPPTPIPVPAVVVAPEPAPVVDTCDEYKGSLDGVNFYSDSAELTDDAKGILDSVASRLSECNTVTARISAHTDSQGAESYNQGLSERRADSVATYLSSQGIASGRLETEAFGETQPISSNATSEGRRENRRVELITVE